MKKERNSALLRSTCPTRPSSSPIIPILPHPFFTDPSPFTFQLPPPLDIPYAHPLLQHFSQTIHTCQDFFFIHPNLNLNPYLWICCPLSYPLDHTSNSSKPLVIIYNEIFYYSSQATLGPNFNLFTFGHQSHAHVVNLVEMEESRQCNSVNEIDFYGEIQKLKRFANNLLFKR